MADGSQPTDTPLLVPDIWDEVVEMAVRHGLAPLLFKRLKESDARTAIPTHAWERLRLAYFAGAGRNTRLYRELGHVLRRLLDEGIRVIVLKGAYLAEAVYGDVGVRPMGDVDIMVPRKDLPRTQAILFDIVGIHERPEDIELLCQERHHLPGIVVRGFPFEVHWTIAPPAGPVRVDTAGLWDRARAVTSAGVGVLALSPEDMLLHLCLNFGHQGLKGLKLLCDTAETVCRFEGEMDWAQVVHLARLWDASRCVGLTLHLARTMLGAAAPDDVLGTLLPGGLDQCRFETAQQCAITQTDCLRSGSPVDDWGAASLGGKVALFRERVFLSREAMVATYPAASGSRHLAWYYVLRLRDVTRTFFAHVLSRGLPTARSGASGRNAALANWLRAGKTR